MAAGLRALLSLADLIDLIVEVRDARLPLTTAVVSLHEKLRRKPLIVLLNREDLAEAAITKAWLRALRAAELSAFAGIGTNARSLGPLRTALLRRERRRARLRVAVVGAPNVGKSSVINALARRKRAPVADRAGVTRAASWLSMGEGVEILDTPGVLAPRI